MARRHRFLIDIPETWDQIDLSGRSLEARRVEALSSPGGATHKAAINAMFRQGRQLLRSALDSGALLAVGTSTSYDDEFFMAYGMVFAVSTPPGQELTLPVLSRQLVGSRPGKVDDRKVSSAEVPAVGRVARVTGTEMLRLGNETKAPLVSMHTMMPVPKRPQHFLMVTFASPNVRLRPAVLDLFDALTSTFRFISDGTPGDKQARAA